MILQKGKLCISMPTIGGNIIKKVNSDCDGKGCPEVIT